MEEKLIITKKNQSEQIGIRMDQELLKRIKRIAFKNHRSVSYVVRKLIIAGIDEVESKS